MFDVSSDTAIADLNDTREPINTFETATDLGEATGEGSISDLTLTSGDIDWFKVIFLIMALLTNMCERFLITRMATLI